MYTHTHTHAERINSNDLSYLEPVPAHIDTWARGIVPLTNDNLLVDLNPFDRLLYKSASKLHPPTDDENKLVVCFM